MSSAVTPTTVVCRVCTRLPAASVKVLVTVMKSRPAVGVPTSLDVDGQFVPGDDRAVLLEPLRSAGRCRNRPRSTRTLRRLHFMRGRREGQRRDHIRTEAEVGGGCHVPVLRGVVVLHRVRRTRGASRPGRCRPSGASSARRGPQVPGLCCFGRGELPNCSAGGSRGPIIGKPARLRVPAVAADDGQNRLVDYATPAVLRKRMLGVASHHLNKEKHDAATAIPMISISNASITRADRRSPNHPLALRSPTQPAIGAVGGRFARTASARRVRRASPA